MGLVQGIASLIVNRRRTAVESIDGLVDAELQGRAVDPANAVEILQAAGMTLEQFQARVETRRQRAAKLAIVEKQPAAVAKMAGLAQREADFEKRRLEFRAWQAAESSAIEAERLAATTVIQQAKDAEQWLLSTASDAAAKRDYENAKALLRAVTDRLSACKRDIDRISKQDLPHATSQLDFNVEHGLPREAEQLRVNQLKSELAELVSTRAKSETLRAERERAVNAAREALIRS